MENNFLDAMTELGEAMEESMKQYHGEAENWWNSLSKEDQLKAFYCVTKRIHHGDISSRSSYRSVLYGIFGFAPDAYAVGMESGYMDIHNAIYTKQDLESVKAQAVEEYKAKNKDSVGE